MPDRQELLLLWRKQQWLFWPSNTKKLEEERRKNEAYYQALVTTTSDVVLRMSKVWSEMQQIQGQGFFSDTGEPIYNCSVSEISWPELHK